MGVSSGFPDFILYPPFPGNPELYIEMKFGSNGLSANQKKWLEALVARGRIAIVSWSSVAVVEYLENRAHLLLTEDNGKRCYIISSDTGVPKKLKRNVMSVLKNE